MTGQKVRKSVRTFCDVLRLIAVVVEPVGPSLTHPEGRGRPPPVDGLRREGRRHGQQLRGGRDRRRNGWPHGRVIPQQPLVGERREAVVHPLALVRVEQHLRRRGKEDREV